ncbi:hypothetical protein [Aliivibrio kagoshimensis]|uniref:hypothetical protein n=1 Tax=Aliivibrio kagoshimensis TaxID=2910230 RepID=UPI003D0B9206
MINKTLIKTVIASSLLLSSTAMAVVTSGSATFNLVAPLATIAGATMDFGDIDISTTGSCGMDSAGVETGTLCLGTGNATTLGAFTVTGNNGLVNLSVGNVAGEPTDVTFAPAVAATDTIALGTLAVNVYGNITVGASATGGSSTVTYDLTVTY